MCVCTHDMWDRMFRHMCTHQYINTHIHIYMYTYLHINIYMYISQVGPDVSAQPRDGLPGALCDHLSAAAAQPRRLRRPRPTAPPLQPAHLRAAH